MAQSPGESNTFYHFDKDNFDSAITHIQTRLAQIKVEKH